MQQGVLFAMLSKDCSSFTTDFIFGQRPLSAPLVATLQKCDTQYTHSDKANDPRRVISHNVFYPHIVGTQASSR